MFDIITIGGAILDIYAMSDNLILTKDILGVRPSTKNEINKGFFTCGGGATNAAVTFSKLELKTGCLALVGDDHLNYFIKRSLKKFGVNRRLLVVDPKSTTDYSIILVAHDGTRSVLVNRGQYDLQEKHIPWSKIQKTKWFYISSLSGNIDLLEKLIGFAKENNIKIALNPGNRELKKRRILIPLLQHVDFLLLNRMEAEDLTQLNFDDKNFWPKLRSYKTKILAVTNGRDGAYVSGNEQIYYSPILNVHAVDETGAGDAFGSAFTGALIYGLKPEEALLWGVRNSASVVSQLGAKNNILTLQQIKQKKLCFQNHKKTKKQK
jgi:sugar/nucleoside kinase (ribokinase family)